MDPLEVSVDLMKVLTIAQNVFDCENSVASDLTVVFFKEEFK